MVIPTQDGRNCQQSLSYATHSEQRPAYMAECPSRTDKNTRMFNRGHRVHGRINMRGNPLLVLIKVHELAERKGKRRRV
uniref:Transposase n=1 Tax=Ascaris lumbricoides TaxID=6252 RepID=A0A0M3IN17_ASCLU